MNSRIGVLTVVLCLQLALIAVLLLRDGGEPARGALLEFAIDQVDRIRITERGSQEAALQLQRGASGWRSDELPVSDQRVAELLQKLAALDSPWPVATTTAAAERFEVTDDGYAKYVELFEGDRPIAQLLLGTSPGFKRIHAKLPGQDAIFSIALSSLDLPMAPAEWLDTSLLGNDLQVQRMARLEHWEAVRQGADTGADTGAVNPEQPGNWSLRSLDSPATAATEPANAAAIAALAARFAQLQVTGIDAGTGEPTDRFEIEGSNERLRYALYHDVDTDSFAVSRDDVAGRFGLPGYVAEQLRADLGNLVQEPTEPEREVEVETAAPTEGEAADG